MISKGTYKLKYTVDKVQEELLVEVDLVMSEVIVPRGNVYVGKAKVNGLVYLKKDLGHYVNARYAAEEIGHELRDEMKTKNKTEGKVFKIKKEELK